MELMERVADCSATTSCRRKSAGELRRTTRGPQCQFRQPARIIVPTIVSSACSGVWKTVEAQFSAGRRKRHAGGVRSPSFCGVGAENLIISGIMTGRTAKLRQQSLDAHPRLSPERALLITEFYQNHAGLLFRPGDAGAIPFFIFAGTRHFTSATANSSSASAGRRPNWCRPFPN